MEPKFQTSFIPKKPIVQAKSSRSSVSLLLLSSIIIFFLAIGVAIFVFLQKKILINEITSEQQTITTNESSFDPDTINSIVELNSRIIAANQLLASHVNVSPIFNFLEQTTLQNVRFTNFTFSPTSNTGGQAGVGVQLSGIARDFETVASQEDEFGLPDWKNIISEPKISGLSLNADGSVSFTFSATINPQFLAYQASSATASSTTQ